MELDAEDRTFLDTNFQRFGSAWAGGLAKIEESFVLEVVKKPTFFSGRFELRFTTRGPERVSFPMTITKKEGAMAGSKPELPDGPPFDQARFEAALGNTKELWLVDGLNDELVHLEATLPAITKGKRFESRAFGDGTDVVYVWESDFFDLFCVATKDGEVIAARWIELPANRSHLLDRATIEFLDRAFKTHGDFGVYGSVTEGFRAIALEPNFQVRIHTSDERYGIDISPRDHHGHFLNFSVDRKTGAIDGCVAGHLEPPPQISDTD